MTEQATPAASVQDSGGSGCPTWPDVTAIVPTHNRPEALRVAVQSILDQDYPGSIECLIVFDGTAPVAPEVKVRGLRTLRLATNVRKPGLAGARNSGVLYSSAEWLAFCDDDDRWLPTKLRDQMTLQQLKGADVVLSGFHVRYGARSFTRTPEAEVSFQMLKRTWASLHPSTWLTRKALFEPEAVGLVDEETPGGYGEDRDWFLRAAAISPIAVLQKPSVVVLWGKTSHFQRSWHIMGDGLSYLIAKHPVLTEDSYGRSRMISSLAFARAAAGQRSEARRLAAQSIRSDWRQPRSYLALLVAARLAKADWLLSLAHSFGRGIA